MFVWVNQYCEVKDVKTGAILSGNEVCKYAPLWSSWSQTVKKSRITELKAILLTVRINRKVTFMTELKTDSRGNGRQCCSQRFGVMTQLHPPCFSVSRSIFSCSTLTSSSLIPDFSCSRADFSPHKEAFSASNCEMIQKYRFHHILIFTMHENKIFNDI